MSRGAVGGLGKVRHPPESLGFLLWGLWISESNFMPIYSVAVEIFQPSQHGVKSELHFYHGAFIMSGLCISPNITAISGFSFISVRAAELIKETMKQELRDER